MDDYLLPTIVILWEYSNEFERFHCLRSNGLTYFFPLAQSLPKMGEVIENERRKLMLIIAHVL